MVHDVFSQRTRSNIGDDTRYDHDGIHTLGSLLSTPEKTTEPKNEGEIDGSQYSIKTDR